MGIIESVYKIDKMTSKYFVPFSIAAYGFLLGWNYSMGENIFSSITQDISILFILVNQGVIISYLTWYKERQ
tara:strand:- start:145 stop:360 length:216 start_codon:yes stop_codon:yes gene_type:complete